MRLAAASTTATTPTTLYPAGDGIFNTDGYNNQGGYSSPEKNSLINDTEYGSSTQAFSSYEDYTAEQLPWLWIPLASNIWVYKSNLEGFAPLNPFSGGLNPEDWYYTVSDGPVPAFAASARRSWS